MEKYSTTADNHVANCEIERWQLKTLGVNPVRHYISKVITIILNTIPSQVIRDTGVDFYIIEDVITQKPDDFMEKNVYDFYEEYTHEKDAARYLYKILEEYMLG